MQKCCFLIIGLILAIFLLADHYDLYVPEIWDLPMPHTISSPSYAFIEAGIASDNSSVFYSDILRSDICVNSFIHNTRDRTVSRFSLRSSKSITGNFLVGIGSASVYRNSQGTRYSSIPLSPFARLHFNTFDITYSPIVSLYSDINFHNDIFQRLSLTFSPNEYSVKLYSSRIAEHGGIAVGYNDLQAGLEFYSNLIYPALTYSSSSEDYSLTVRSGFRYSRPLDYYTGLFSPLMDSVSHYREGFVYSLNTMLQVHSFSFDIMSSLADEPDNYSDIHYSDIRYKIKAGYFMRIDRTLLEASVSAVKTDAGNWNYGDIHLRHDREHFSSGIVHEIQYVHGGITNILSAYIVFHAPIALKTGVRNILSQDDYVNYYYNSERTFFINFEYSSGQFIR